MPSALEQITQGYQTSEPVNFTNYYNAWRKDNYSNNPSSYLDQNPYSLSSKLENLFTGQLTSAEKAYENYLSQYEYEQNKKASAAANRETYAREDSQIQRLMADYRKAGLNPYLLLSGGNLSSGVVSSQAQRPDYKRSSKQSQDRSKNGSIFGTALKLLAILALKG